MNIGLIDVDGHNFPNLALMRISSYHKARGDTVEWWWGWGHYDIVYMSKIFSDAYPVGLLLIIILQVVTLMMILAQTK